MSESDSHFTVGMRVRMLKGDKVILEGTVLSFTAKGHGPEVELDRTDRPGEKMKLRFVANKDPNEIGWRMLVKNPDTGRNRFTQRKRFFTIEPV